MGKRGFGELELAILRILRTKERMSVGEVHKMLGEKNNYNTIMTVMLRLSEKKVLQREKVGSHYEYWLTSSQDQVPTFFEQLKQRVFGIKTTELISYLLDSSEEITEEELAEVQKLLTKAQAKIKKKQS